LSAFILCVGNIGRIFYCNRLVLRSQLFHNRVNVEKGLDPVLHMTGWAKLDPALHTSRSTVFDKLEIGLNVST